LGIDHQRRRAERQQCQHGFHFRFHFVLSFSVVVLPGAIFKRNLRERTLRRREAGKLFPKYFFIFP